MPIFFYFYTFWSILGGGVIQYHDSIVVYFFFSPWTSTSLPPCNPLPKKTKHLKIKCPLFMLNISFEFDKQQLLDQVFLQQVSHVVQKKCSSVTSVLKEKEQKNRQELVEWLTDVDVILDSRKLWMLLKLLFIFLSLFFFFFCIFIQTRLKKIIIYIKKGFASKCCKEKERKKVFRNTRQIWFKCFRVFAFGKSKV